MVLAGFVTFIFGLLFLLMSAVGAGRADDSVVFATSASIATDAASVMNGALLLVGEIVTNVQWVGVFALGVLLTWLGGRLMSSTS
jgi:hypothetical protein